MSNQDLPRQIIGQKRRADTALVYPDKKRPVRMDPMVHVGRHFGRTVSTVVNMKALITEGIARAVRLEDHEVEFDDLDLAEQREHGVFTQLLAAVPDLFKRWEQSDEAGAHLCDMIQKGIASSRSEDTKSLKGVILDWIITPGQPVNPPLLRHTKYDRGYNHHITGRLLCPANMDWSDSNVVEGLRSGSTRLLGVHWPLFLYENHEYNREDPWKGLFKGKLLVRAYKHVFTSPSSANNEEAKATRSGNARIHGMSKVTLASIAYVATQVRFALSSHNTFARTNCVTETEQFFHTCMDLFLDRRELAEINGLLLWWNTKVFPAYFSAEMPIPDDTPLARIRAKRDAEEAAKAAAEAAAKAAAEPAAEAAA
ncbi:hypothetical protein HWV62_10555 [Athelia sp. TMB]|nr:hypothetical protein HWV62_10555 [Athelia sp. TMB]